MRSPSRFASAQPWLWSDSFLDQVGTTENLRRNGIDESAVRFLGPFDPLPDRIDTVVVKVPKTLTLLDDQLRRLRPHLHPDTLVVGAGMTKHIHTSTINAFDALIGPTTTSLAQRKSRLIHSTFDAEQTVGEAPWPSTRIEGALTVVNHANVFSKERLDIGTRFLLENLPEPAAPGETRRVVDLGCGNGIVGVSVAIADPEAELVFVDESFMAVASAEATFAANLGPDRTARFVVGDTLFHLAAGEPIERGSVDLVLNNPPFHDDHALSDATAWQMFTEAHGALRSGGEIRVVGNRHLAYHAKLKRIFGNCRVVASNSKFVVFSATK
ncbi:MAG: methyltransferase [Acidimicrobiales bacterium]